MKMKEVQVPRDPARCWKSYLPQCDEACGLLAKMQAAARERFSTGPPLHDCLFVAKRTTKKLLRASCQRQLPALQMLISWLDPRAFRHTSRTRPST